MSGERFLDTNVLVYLVDRTDPRKSDIAEQIVRSGIELGDACISFQVVQETLNVLTQKARIRLSPEQAQLWFDSVLAPLYRVQPSAELYRDALALKSRFGLHFYDAVIVASARLAGCRRLLTEDLQHEQRFGDLVVENPFA